MIRSQVSFQLNEMAMFYPEGFKPEFDLNKLDFVAQQKFEEIPTLSQFNYLNTPSSVQKVFSYDNDGTFEFEETLDEFFSDGIKGGTLEVFKALRENELPVYSRRIYSKYFIKNLYVSDKIPFAQFDIIDEQFNRDFDKEFKLFSSKINNRELNEISSNIDDDVLLEQSDTNND